jgi:hypothetical protein
MQERAEHIAEWVRLTGGKMAQPVPFRENFNVGAASAREHEHRNRDLESQGNGHHPLHHQKFRLDGRHIIVALA